MKIAIPFLIATICMSTARMEDSSGRIEAEEMELNDYEVVSGQSTEYIKLNGPEGVARFDFPLPSGTYDVDVRYLSESAGQNTYTLYIGENQIVAFLGKDRDDQWHTLSEQKWHVPKDIEIRKGEEVRIGALSENGSKVILDYVQFTDSSRSDSGTKKHLVTVYPEEYEHAIRNPLKGFRPSTMSPGMENGDERFNSEKPFHEYGTLIKSYFKWNEFENAKGDGVDKIIEACDAAWKGIESRNVKVIPRVYLAWPDRAGGWPADMTTGDFTSDQFRERVVAFIKKLGQAWDGDPRVAYVEMGLIGEWGEMEWPDTTDEIKAAMSAEFATAFQNKHVMIRWPNTYNDDIYDFGYYWDSFAHQDQMYYGYHLKKTSPRWRIAPIGGETAYNWGNVNIQPGGSPDISLSQPRHLNYIVDQIRKLHANHLGWIADYDQSDATVRAGAQSVQKALGYRFVIDEVNYPEIIDEDRRFTLSFRVKNVGSSPFYYEWPVEVSLLDPDTREPVWKQQCRDLDIRAWLPGDQWDEGADVYRVAPESNLVNQTFSVPDSIPSGEYVLALAILDPAVDRPAVRFAIANYYNGGRHPIGKVGINKPMNSFHVFEFDDIQSDTSLSYVE